MIVMDESMSICARHARSDGVGACKRRRHRVCRTRRNGVYCRGNDAYPNSAQIDDDCDGLSDEGVCAQLVIEHCSPVILWRTSLALRHCLFHSMSVQRVNPATHATATQMKALPVSNYLFRQKRFLWATGSPLAFPVMKCCPSLSLQSSSEIVRSGTVGGIEHPTVQDPRRLLAHVLLNALVPLKTVWSAVHR